jgi:hypothetical protein
VSIVSRNLMTQPGYTPYCGDAKCRFTMPRTIYRDGQFRCRCGWASSFDPEFIAAYEARWADPATQVPAAGSPPNGA